MDSLHFLFSQAFCCKEENLNVEMFFDGFCVKFNDEFLLKIQKTFLSKKTENTERSVADFYRFGFFFFALFQHLTY